jgi:A nuclease family of the HNH/ENDO VII superfamily with conserved AHH
MRGQAIPSPPIRFHAVTLPSSDMHRHHIIPVRLFRRGSLSPFLKGLRAAGVMADDFAANGLFLPAAEETAAALRLPLHRGPHRHYSELVEARIAAIAHTYRGKPPSTLPIVREAAWRIRMLQTALSRVLTEGRLARPLNRFDPMLQAQDFTAIDAMIDRLWGGSEGV